MPGGGGNFNRLVIAPGEALELGASGGRLLLNPPAQIAGQMTLTDMENRLWHLLREPGPDTGFPPPETGDFPQDVVDRDLNIMLGQFVSATGLAPTLSDKQVTIGIIPILDMPLPPDYQSITRIEYTPAGQQTYTLIPASFAEFDTYWQNETSAMGQPFVYRQPWAGYIRLFPQPGPGQAYGPGIGTVTFAGTPDAGDTVQITLTNGSMAPVVVPTYVVLASDTTASVAQAVANLIAASNACVGPTAFLQVPGVSDSSFQLTAITAPGTQITYLTTFVAGEMTVTPNGIANLAPNGDTMTFYYSSTGDALILPGDTPGIPVQFHMAIVYGVLADYWLRKQDPDGLARVFKTRFDEAVLQAKRLEWDSNRATQPNVAAFWDNALDYSSGTII